MLKQITITCFFLFVSIVVLAAEPVGSGQTNDNNKLVLYSDGTWKYDKAPGSKNSKTISYLVIKEKIRKLCGASRADSVIGLINSGMSVAQIKGVSKERYWACINEATGCYEIASFAPQCIK